MIEMRFKQYGEVWIGYVGFAKWDKIETEFQPIYAFTGQFDEVCQFLNSKVHALQLL